MTAQAFTRRELLQRIPAMTCGLYRTGVPLPKKNIEIDRLVMLHDHRPEELPQVFLPLHNLHNHWAFSEEPYDADDAIFLEGLEPLPDEGLYVLSHRIQLSEDPDDVLPERTLVMLGYDGNGHSILFPARYDLLSISFPEHGYRFDSPNIFDNLEPVNFQIPLAVEERSVH